MKNLFPLPDVFILSADYSGLAAALITGAIIALILIGGVLFLIIYGALKKKKKFWITGTVIAALWLLIYLFFYLSRYNETMQLEQEATEQIENR